MTPFGKPAVKLPSLSTVAFVCCPPGNVTVTSEFGSAVPVTLSLLLVTLLTLGLSGAVLSSTVA